MPVIYNELKQFRHVYRVYKWQISWVSYPRTVELPLSSRESRFHKDDDDTSLFISLLVKLTGPISAPKFQEHKLNPLLRQDPGVEVFFHRLPRCRRNGSALKKILLCQCLCLFIQRTLISSNEKALLLT